MSTPPKSCLLVTAKAHGYIPRNTVHPCWQDTLELEACNALGVKLRVSGREIQQQGPAAGHVWALGGHGPLTYGHLAHVYWAVAGGEQE